MNSSLDHCIGCFGIHCVQQQVHHYPHEPDQLRKEVAVLKLIQKKIPTSELLYAGDRKEGASCNYTILRYLPGVSLDETPASRVQIASHRVGEVLGKLHQIKVPASGQLDENLAIPLPLAKKYNPYCTAVRNILTERGLARSRLGEKFANELLVYIETHGQRFPQSEAPASLLHGDLHVKNILFDEPDQIYLLDWEHAQGGPAILDLANLLRWTALDLQALEEGYRSGGGKLADDWRRQIGFAHFLNVAIMLDAPGLPPSQIDYATNWARQLMAY